LMSKYYLTTAIPYVNAAPHIGHALEFVQADVIARYRRARGDDVRLTTGADENSLKNVQAAEAKGIATAVLCEENAVLFRKMADVLGLSYTNFVRTSASPEHRRGVQQIWELCNKSGDIYKKNYKGLYCVGCEAFYEEHELVDGLCPEHKRAPEVVEEENYFFRLSKYQKRIEEMITSGQLRIIPESRMKEVLQFIHSGLKDFSISRSMKRARGWGIPVPGDPSQVMYVWFDALGTYITGVGYGSDQETFNKYWPADVHVIGKGILRFHALYWPAMLLSAGIALPKNILVHGYITVEGQKMSKSLGNIVDPIGIAERFGSDALRYCLLSEVSTFDDGDFSERVLVEKNNNELVANVGNLVNRTMVFIKNNFDGKVPAPARLTQSDEQFISKQRETFEHITELLDQFRLKDAISEVMEYSSNANKYFQENQPWKVIKSERERAGTVLYILANQVKDIGILIGPYLPSASTEIFRQLNIALGNNRWQDVAVFSLPAGHVLSDARPIFRKMDITEIRAAAESRHTVEAAQQMHDFGIENVDLEVGEIVSAERHPNADKLLVERVRVGDGERQIVSGIARYYKPEELIGRKIILVKNLKPAVLRGIKSEGMLLAAVSGNDVEVIFCEGCRVGDKVAPKDGRCSYREQITIDEFATLNLEVKDGRFLADGREMTVDGKAVRTHRVLSGRVG